MKIAIKHSMFSDKDKSFWTDLIVCFDKITDFLMKGNTVDLISLDFRKAFVMVPHGKLLSGRVWRLGEEF